MLSNSGQVSSTRPVYGGTVVGKESFHSKP